MFNYWVGGGRIDVGFLGAAQIDRKGNINTTVIGDYGSPKVRLPGAGGAPEIAARAREVIVLVRHSKRVFVEKIDFITSIGPAGAPIVVITDLGVLRPGTDGELELSAVHAGVEADQVREATGWDLRVAEDLQHTPPPSDEELETLRALRASAERAPGPA
jgi:glutaconate CoA-transferase, subunit B